MIYTCGGVLFDTLNSINADEYLQETKKIINEVLSYKFVFVSFIYNS